MINIREFLLLSLENVLEQFSEIYNIKKIFSGKKIETCAIVNAKSGKCVSDCKFCAQSLKSSVKIKVYPLLTEEKLFSAAEEAFSEGINRFSFVCSGVRVSKEDVEKIASVVEKLKSNYKSKKICVSLGQIDKDSLKLLKLSGVDRYHHNLETSKEFYPSVSTVQNWEDRYKTVALAKEVGFSVCSGGIFGLGETVNDVVSLFKSLRELEVDSIPLNFLHPIKGTAFENNKFLTPLKALKIVFAARVFFKDKVIRICGGREYNFRELQPFAISVVDGLMVGNYLTTKGRTLDTDKQLLEDLGFKAFSDDCLIQ
ncbi:biotin synthase BioB [Desulfurobacterium atlanticum]|uniref:Biotin synthase n=1 Tax=Desulfurobacterium atlanticum TaxID=240169 RepID=A0A238XKW1_9BACT|nr:biotin synthase BioB [Desulfurobacterium atlanticum]SNR58964.1 biotin synthase [Desulfurobacterium atlanticum]